METVKLRGVAKYYKLYKTPSDRLKEVMHPFGKQYHTKYYALKKIDLTIKEGEVLGVVGKNGSGKSTLLKLLSRVLVPDEGEIKICGRLTALLELGAGFNPEFTGIQNVYFYGAILGFNKREMDERVEEVLAFADIGDFINQPLKTYSSGMKSRLGFAVAVHVDPDILVLDEVLAVGDAEFQKKCYGKIRDFLDRNKTVIFVSHNPGTINEFCTRAILLHEGVIVFDDEPKKVTDYYHKLVFSHNQSVVLQELEERKAKSDCSEVEHDKHPVVSPVVTNSYVSIRDIRILDDEGSPVSVVKKGGVYTIEYLIENSADTEFENVSLGFVIKSIKGTVIGGSRDVFAFDGCGFKPGDVYVVRRKLKIDLIAGASYVIKIDVLGDIDSEEVVLCSIADALLFDVYDEARICMSRLVGMVDLMQDISISKI